MRLLNRIIDLCNLFLATLAGICLGILLLAVCYAAFARFAFDTPHANLIEIAAYSLLYITFLSAPWLLQLRKHISVDIFVVMLSKRKQAISGLCTDIFGFFVCLVSFYYSYLTVLSNYKSKVVIMDSMYTPQYLLLIAVPIGFFFLGIQFLRNAKENFDFIRPKEGGKS